VRTALFLATLVIGQPALSEPFVAPPVKLAVPIAISEARARALYRWAGTNCVFFAYLQDRQPALDWRERRKKAYLECVQEELEGTGITVSEDTDPAQ